MYFCLREGGGRRKDETVLGVCVWWFGGELREGSHPQSSRFRLSVDRLPERVISSDSEVRKYDLSSSYDKYASVNLAS